MVLLTLFLIPALMLSDYYLTLIGERLRQQSESRRLVRLESYELNPLFRKDVARLRWFNWRHLAATAGITALMVFLAYGYVLEVSPVPFLGILGFYAVLFGVIIGRHLQSILAFADTLKQPQVDVETAQKPIISLEDTLKLTQGSNISLLPPFGLCALISRSEFMVGGFGGILMLILMNFIWLKQHQLKQRRLVKKQ